MIRENDDLGIDQIGPKFFQGKDNCQELLFGRGIIDLNLVKSAVCIVYGIWFIVLSLT